MAAIYLLINILFWCAVITLITGIIKPWFVLWFLDYKNRITVLKYYGTIALMLGIALIIIRYLL